MSIPFKNYIRTFFTSNYFIALCAASMILATQMLSGLQARFTPYLVFLTASTFLLYNFHKYSFRMDFSKMKNLFVSVYKLKLKNHEMFFYFCAAIISIDSFLILNKQIYYILVPMVVLSLAYSIPIYKVGMKRMKLREINTVKTPLLAFVWGASVTLIPVIEQNINPFSSFVWMLLVCNSLFIFCLCIPFDLRDIETDRVKNIRTFPVIFGSNNFKKAGIVLTVLQVVIHHSIFSDKELIALTLDLSSVAALYWIIIQDKSKRMFFYKFLVDGTMIFRFLLIYTAFKLS